MAEGINWHELKAPYNLQQNCCLICEEWSAAHSNSSLMVSKLESGKGPWALAFKCSKDATKAIYHQRSKEGFVEMSMWFSAASARHIPLLIQPLAKQKSNHSEPKQVIVDLHMKPGTTFYFSLTACHCVFSHTCWQLGCYQEHLGRECSIQWF